MKLGFDNKRKTTGAIVLGVIAVLVCAYEFLPMITESSSPSSNAQAAAPAPVPSRPATPVHGSTKSAKKEKPESLDPTLQLDLLATAEKTTYEGSGRNIFVSQREDVVIQKPIAPANTDNPAAQAAYQPPPVPAPPQIPLKFYGFSGAKSGPKQVFLSKGDDIFIAKEGQIVDRRYKIVKIGPNSVEVEDVLTNNRQTLPLTAG